MKVLLVQIGTAADVVLSTLLIRCLKMQVESAELHVLVMHQQAEILRLNSYVDKLHLIHFNWQTTAEELKLQKFNHVINLNENKESKAIIEALHFAPVSKSGKGFKTFWQRLFQRTGPTHPAEYYLGKAAFLGVVNDGNGLNYSIPNKAEVPYADIPASHHAGFIAIAVSAFEGKQWTLLFLQQLAAAIQHPLILIGTEEDRELGEKVKAVDDIKVYNACGKFSAQETADLVRKSKLLLTSHPYYVQLAAALKKEIIWLQVQKSAPPYYSQRYLKTRTTPAFDTIKVSAQLFNNEEKGFEELAQNIAASAGKFLKAKA